MNYSTVLLIDQNQTDVSNDNLSATLACPIWTQYDHELTAAFEYWLGGVTLCCISIPGLVMNLMAIYFLSTRTSIHTTFNSLLVSPFVLDSFYLFFETIETFRRRFQLETRIHTILLPKFLYPLTIISLSASIFMTVGVAHERYDAIKQPIVHRQSMRSAKFRRQKFMKYILTVFVLAVCFNLPKFFEVELRWENDMDAAMNINGSR